jgi:glutamyl-tRNA reductase
MALHCYGVTHRDTPVEVRERFAFTPEQLTATLHHVAGARQEGKLGLAEVAVLSTCNRTELYAVTSEDDHAGVLREAVTLLADSLDIAPDLSHEHLRGREGVAVVQHLSRVASGLDSMVLGESEILGQVSEAHRLATKSAASGPVLAEVFRTAIRSGRRARAETAIGRNPASVSSVAIRLAGRVAGDLQGLSATLVGAGRMARKALATLRANGVAEITVVNRTAKRSEALAGDRVSLRPWDQLEESVARSDIVFCATTAADPVITADLIQRTGRPPGSHPLIIVDIGVPRNVDPAVRLLAHVRVIDLDDIERSLEESLDLRRREIPAVERIVTEETAEFMARQARPDVRPVLRAIWQQAEVVRQDEVRKLVERMPELTAAGQAHIDSLSRALVTRLLETPSQRLRQSTGNGDSANYARLVRELFDVPDA